MAKMVIKYKDEGYVVERPFALVNDKTNATLYNTIQTAIMGVCAVCKANGTLHRKDFIIERYKDLK